MDSRLAFALALAGAIIVSGCTAQPAKDYTAFASCLTDSGITEYGAYWCPNCARVKLTFGDAWENLDYAECDPKCVKDSVGNLPDYCNGFESQTNRCLELGVNKYPSWVKGSGEIIYVGTDLGELAQASGCSLP